MYPTVLWIEILQFFHFSAAEIEYTVGIKPNFCFLAGNSKTQMGQTEYDLFR